MIRYPSKILFQKNNDHLAVSYKQQDACNYNLDIWAIAYLLNESMYKDGCRCIHLPVDNITMALRLHFLSETKLFKDIHWDTKYQDEVETLLHDILVGIKNQKYVTYKDMLSKRNTKSQRESLLEANICKDLSQLYEHDFDISSPKIRQFPANIFKGKICEETRITGKYWIDVLAMNKGRQLSVIELKAGDNTELDIFVQALNYAVYCHLFKTHIGKYHFDNAQNSEEKIAIYLAADRLHPALIGNEDIVGVQSLIRANDSFDFIFLEMDVKDNKIASKPKTLLDTRNNESNNS